MYLVTSFNMFIYILSDVYRCFQSIFSIKHINVKSLLDSRGVTVLALHVDLHSFLIIVPLFQFMGSFYDLAYSNEPDTKILQRLHRQYKRYDKELKNRGGIFFGGWSIVLFQIIKDYTIRVWPPYPGIDA